MTHKQRCCCLGACKGEGKSNYKYGVLVFNCTLLLLVVVVVWCVLYVVEEGGREAAQGGRSREVQ